MRFRSTLVVLVLLFIAGAGCTRVFADNPVIGELPAKYLADRIDKSQATAPARPLTTEYDEFPAIQSAPISSAAGRTYTGPTGRFDVMLFETESESAAYALFTSFRDAVVRLGQTSVNQRLGASSSVFRDQALLAKGKLLVHIISAKHGQNEKALSDFAVSFAETLPRGEDEIPVLVKHLPRWETEPRDVHYYVTLDGLKAAASSPVLNSVSFEGAEAVSADYGGAQLLLIEFPTPQLATQNDQQILAKLQELRTQGQPLPTVYRRVGNYGVFVFNGQDETSASALVNEVKYEQVTQWLGDNPYPLLEAQRRYTATTLGVLVSVVKASGIALVLCFTAGGLFGGLLFLRRRAQQRTEEAYSDAGGMVRLNLDELTAQTDPARLLSK